MKRFEYDITIHGAEAFQQLVYFCTSDGECREEAVPSTGLTAKLTALLNGRGREGWELVQVTMSQRGVVAFWKRELDDDDNKHQ